MTNPKDPFPWINNYQYDFSEWLPPAKLTGTAFAERRIFFERNPSHCNGSVVCPCCGYPTIRYRNHWEYCSLCEWEDDGQDDPWADYENCGPNGSTLNEARIQFKKTFSSHFTQKDIDEMTGDYREATLRNLNNTKRICKLMDELIHLKDGRIKLMWDKIERIYSEIRIENDAETERWIQGNRRSSH